MCKQTNCLSAEAQPCARVVTDYGNRFELELNGEVFPAFHATRDGNGIRPAVGDWVRYEDIAHQNGMRITGVLERRGVVSRKASGKRVEHEQIIATNVDVVFIVTAVGYDYNLSRVERYLTFAWSTGARPVVLLSKCDLESEVDVLVGELQRVSGGARVLAVSSVTGTGLEPLREMVAAGLTCVFVGSSGVGKSSLVNALIGETVMRVNSLRKGLEKGQHTTTNRQLWTLPGGGAVIDSPGMRELQLTSADGNEQTFADLEDLTRACRFRDCQHETEPGCAILAAIAGGAMDERRLRSWRKLKREEARLQESRWERSRRMRRTANLARSRI
jgi:ribosome biogenesis GTPase